VDHFNERHPLLTFNAGCPVSFNRASCNTLVSQSASTSMIPTSCGPEYAGSGFESGDILRKKRQKMELKMSSTDTFLHVERRPKMRIMFEGRTGRSWGLVEEELP